MLKEKKPVLKIKMKVENSSSINKYFEPLYSLYDFLLDEPIEIFFLDFFSILLSYLQLISFIFDDTVSIIQNINLYSIY
jgi:hypothetical protein